MTRNDFMFPEGTIPMGSLHVPKPLNVLEGRHSCGIKIYTGGGSKLLPEAGHRRARDVSPGAQENGPF